MKKYFKVEPRKLISLKEKTDIKEIQKIIIKLLLFNYLDENEKNKYIILFKINFFSKRNKIRLLKMNINNILLFNKVNSNFFIIKSTYLSLIFVI